MRRARPRQAEAATQHRGTSTVSVRQPLSQRIILVLFALQAYLRRGKLVLKLTNLSRACHRMADVMLALELVDLDDFLRVCHERLELTRKVWVHVFLGVLHRLIQRHDLFDRLSAVRRCAHRWQIVRIDTSAAHQVTARRQRTIVRV